VTNDACFHKYCDQPSSGSIAGSGPDGFNLLTSAPPYSSEERMRRTQVQVLDHLHVVARHDHTLIAKLPHPTALKPGESYRDGTGLTSYLQSTQDVRRVAASADRKSDVITAYKVG
jgi:hypothetical protein